MDKLLKVIDCKHTVMHFYNGKIKVLFHPSPIYRKLENFLTFVYFIRHGDMLFLSQEVSTTGKEAPEFNSASITPTTTSAALHSSKNNKEDEIDVFLSKHDGLIHRERDPQL